MSVHPELWRRYELLVGRTWMFGTEIWVEASERSYATQADLFKRWNAGTYRVPSVANPDRILGPSPWGWDIKGSYHMVQGDGYAHALDIGWRGLSDTMMTEILASCGLRQTVLGEKWHVQWWQGRTIFDVQESPTEDDDMTLDELARAFGPKAQLGADGVIYLPLATDAGIIDKTGEVEMYPIGDVMTYIHMEGKMMRLNS